jgi:hypothetical protein
MLNGSTWPAMTTTTEKARQHKPLREIAIEATKT